MDNNIQYGGSTAVYRDEITLNTKLQHIDMNDQGYSTGP